MQNITLKDLSKMPIGKIPNLTLAQLIKLTKEVDTKLSKFKHLKNSIDNALRIKYKQYLANNRHKINQEGSINFQDGEFLVIYRPINNQASSKSNSESIKKGGQNV